jgi:hypothetical protein
MRLRGLLLFGALGGLGACGPKTDDVSWAVGEYSGASEEGFSTLSVDRLDIHDDGTLRFFSVGQCWVAESENHVREYLWEPEREAVIRVYHPDGEQVEGRDELRISPGSECSSIDIARIRNGEVTSTQSMYRGALCLIPPSETCSDGPQCDSCETVWCSEPPPACE